MLCVAAKPATAQTKNQVDLSAGYQYIALLSQDDSYDTLSVPKGWTASVSGQLSPMLGVVGEVNGSYKEGESLHNFLAGPRFGTNATPQVRPFAQILFGLSHFSGSSNGFNTQPGGGLDFHTSDSVSIRLQADYAIIRVDESTQKAWRLAGSVVCNLNR